MHVTNHIETKAMPNKTDRFSCNIENYTDCKPEVAVPAPNTDHLLLTSETASQLAEKNALIYNADAAEEGEGMSIQNLLKEQNMILEQVRRMAKQMENGIEKQNESYDNFSKCLKIASRIMNGDRVPIKDEQFLAKNESAMYLRASMLRRRNDDPEDYDSLLDDESKDEYSDMQEFLRSTTAHQTDATFSSSPSTEGVSSSPESCADTNSTP